MELDKKLQEYQDELFSDLGLVVLSEEKKAEIFARLEDHLHQVVLEYLAKIVNNKELAEVEAVLEQENYVRLSKILKKHSRRIATLEEKVQQEFNALKVTIGEELKNAGQDKSS